MKFTYLALSLTLGAQVLARPARVILEGENGIIVEDDGSTKIDGETGITTNAQGQTTNLGGKAGITIGGTPPANVEGTKPVEPGAKVEGETTPPNTGAPPARVEEGPAAPVTPATPQQSGGGTQGLIDLLNAVNGAAPKNNSTKVPPTAGTTGATEPGPAAPNTSSSGGLAALLGALQGVGGGTPKGPTNGTTPEEAKPATEETVKPADGTTEAAKPTEQGAKDQNVKVAEEVSKSEETVSISCGSDGTLTKTEVANDEGGAKAKRAEISCGDGKVESIEKN